MRNFVEVIVIVRNSRIELGDTACTSYFFTCCIFRKANNMPRGEPKLKKSVTSKSSGGGRLKSVCECEPAVDLLE